MADEAFALSPISARAAQPSEEDYDAISEAFMETSRGRWFLGEYAKRNRNADTRMVLDAVARIEQSLAAQKQPEPAPVADNGLAEAVESIKAALIEARASASFAIDSLALERHLAPVRKGARVIREISWRWREIGADSRICDLIDSQVSAIEAGCGQIASADPHTALGAAFDLIARQLAAFDDSDDVPPQDASLEVAAEAAGPPSPALSADMSAASVEQAEVSTGEAEAGASAQAVATEQTVATADVVEMNIEAAETSPEICDLEASDPAPQAAALADTETEMTPEAAAITDVDGMSDEAADAHDDAVLERIAAEMAAFDPSDGETETDHPEMLHAEPRVAEPEMIAPAEGVAIAPAMAPAIEPGVPAALQSAPQRPAEPLPKPLSEPEPEPSIGSTLVAGGLLRKQAAANDDPLAAIRRLSQAEKIALFS